MSVTSPRYSDELTWVTDGSEPEGDGIYWIMWHPGDDAMCRLSEGVWRPSGDMADVMRVLGAPRAWAGPLLPPPPPVPRRAPGYWWARREGGPGLEVVRVDEDGTWADTAGNTWGDDARDAALWTCWSRAVPPVGVAE